MILLLGSNKGIFTYAIEFLQAYYEGIVQKDLQDTHQLGHEIVA
jgi:hypothetical protein